MFYVHFLSQYFSDKKLQIQKVTREKLCKALLSKKIVHKMLMKLIPVVVSIVESVIASIVLTIGKFEQAMPAPWPEVQLSPFE